MKTLRLTSPGVLLILAISAAGGIFLLDFFYLRPQVERHKWGALRERAAAAQYAAELALRREGGELAGAAKALSGSAELRRALASGGPGAFEALASRVLPETAADCAWARGSSGRLVGRWARAELACEAAEGRRVPAATGDLAGGSALEAEGGLMEWSGGVAVFSRQKVRAPGPSGAPLGELWLVRVLGGGSFREVNSMVGGKVVFLPADRLPDGRPVAEITSNVTWLGRQDSLTVAWPAVSDATGRVMGYFRAELPAGSAHRQAVAARRMVLIVLTLSMGLALLVIVGNHVLIAGPIARLMKRLQQVELGGCNASDLTRDMHGEPRMLARRLATAFDRLAEMSNTDQLTGLANRRHFEEVLRAFYTQARRYSRRLSVMIMDVDYFKAINDTAGHQAGDRVLRDVAGVLTRTCRKADLPARLGGDEFCVLLPETTAAEGAEVAERIRQFVAQMTVKADALEMNATTSISVADLNAGEIDSPDAMLAAADKALYAAKQQGRNRVVRADSLDGPDAAGAAGETGKVETLTAKLAGLDGEFKALLVRGMEELANLVGERDPHMARHSQNVAHYARLIAAEMELPERVICSLETAAMLHDIGMSALPDSVLLCPGALNDEQLCAMRRHPLLSVRIMEGMEFLDREIPAVRYHHERYDGRGYPEGISGGAIPLSARILAVADAFDAMVSPRVFRDAKGRTEALAEVGRCAGAQFDPIVVEALESLAERLGEAMMAGAAPADRRRTAPVATAAGAADA